MIIKKEESLVSEWLYPNRWAVKRERPLGEYYFIAFVFIILLIRSILITCLWNKNSRNFFMWVLKTLTLFEERENRNRGKNNKERTQQNFV